VTAALPPHFGQIRSIIFSPLPPGNLREHKDQAGKRGCGNKPNIDFAPVSTGRDDSILENVRVLGVLASKDKPITFPSMLDLFPTASAVPINSHRQRISKEIEGAVRRHARID